jgi:hypothetical protein
VIGGKSCGKFLSKLSPKVRKVTEGGMDLFVRTITDVGLIVNSFLFPGILCKCISKEGGKARRGEEKRSERNERSEK